jgi:hypothetical protein
VDDFQDRFERDRERLDQDERPYAALRSSWPFIQATFARLMAGALKFGAGIWNAGGVGQRELHRFPHEAEDKRPPRPLSGRT